MAIRVMTASRPIRGRLAALHTMGDTRRLESAAIAGGAERTCQ